MKNLFNPKKNFDSAGFGLTEIIVAVSIIAFSILIVWRIYTLFIKISISNPSFFQASFLAEEGIEAVKFMRDSNWSSQIAPLSSGTFYTLIFDGTTWKTTSTPAFIDDRFDRRISVSNVFRDVSGNISENGSPDADTRKVTVTVSWTRDTGTTTRKITTYVSNIFDN